MTEIVSSTGAPTIQVRWYSPITGEQALLDNYDTPSQLGDSPTRRQAAGSYQACPVNLSAES
jgi:hypothetical protein